VPLFEERFERPEIFVTVGVGLLTLSALTPGALRDAFLLLAGVVMVYGLRVSDQREQARAKIIWDASRVRFEEGLRTVSRLLWQLCAEAFHSSRSPYLTFRDLTKVLTRYPPDLAGGPLHQWAAHNEAFLEPGEDVALRLARQLYQSPMVIDTPPDSARKAMTVEVEHWNDWASERAFQRYARDKLVDLRGALVVHAYLEVACAELVQVGSHAPAWANLGERLPVIFAHQPAPSGSA